MSVPRRKTNGTAPGRVACQSLKGETANKKTITTRKGRYFCVWQKNSRLCGSMKWRRNWAFPNPMLTKSYRNSTQSYAYKIVQKLNAELKNLGYLTISGRVNRKFFYEKLCYGEKEGRGI